MENPASEEAYEKAVIELFQGMGYTHVYGPEVAERDYRSPLYEEELDVALRRINPHLPNVAIEEAKRKLKSFEHADLVQNNALFTDYLQNGMTVRYVEKGEGKDAMVYLVDYDDAENNSFIVANQWRIEENSARRPDILLFVNGLPLVLMELKSPSRENTDVSEAYRQIQNYKHEIPSVFIYNAICVMSDLLHSKAGTITSAEDRFMEWKTTDGKNARTGYARFDVFFKGIFEKARFLDIVKNFICFAENTKILAAYHQYFAVKKAIERTKIAVETDRKGGVFWHTQGSGKSLSMVFYAKLLQQELSSPTVVVLTDRNDLDAQLFGQFSKCSDFLRQTPVQATSRASLKALLESRKANGIFFTTIQKFEEGEEPLSERRNIIVISDEAHRSQYGLTEKADARTGKIKTGMARVIRDSLPHATYLGFTGTPIALKDRNTQEVFGDIIDVYDMTQAVEDGATRPVYYESRVIKLKLDDEILAQIDEEYDAMADEADPWVIEKSKRNLAQLETILGDDRTIHSLVSDMVKHYEENRAHLLTGKAMIVAYSRPIAMKIYHKILELRPQWKEKTAVVMTSSNNDPQEWHDVVGNEKTLEERARQFKDNSSALKITIVVDMWLTGFDVPSLATMYVYKPMRGHNLMQTIARVNRVFGDKEGGLVIDYIGIANALKQAMKEYTKRDNENYGDTDIGTVAMPRFLEKLEICRDLLHGYDYNGFAGGTDLERSKLIGGAVDFLFAPDKTKEKASFINEVQLMRRALSLCSSIVPQEKRIEAAFMEAVRVLLFRLSDTGENKKIFLPEMNSRIAELLKQSIQSDGVINLFSDFKEAFSLFEPRFLEELAAMKEKNVALEVLKKLIAEQISTFRRTSIVKSEKFSKLMQEALNRYLNGMLTNEQVIEELLKLAAEIADAKKAGDDSGLSEEEAAFYDALAKPQAVPDFYKNDELKALAKELTETLRKNKTVDMYKRTQARAQIQMVIKRLLKRHKYPPENTEETVDLIMRQGELWEAA